LSKKAYLADPDQYLNQGFDPAKRIANITGGSTAEPLRFVMDRYDVEHYGLHVGVACPGGTFPMAAEAS